MQDRKNGSSMQDRYLIMVGLMLIVLLSTASIVQLVHIGNLERIFNKRAENCISQKNSLVEENVALTKQNEYLLDEIEGKVSGPTIPILSDEIKESPKKLTKSFYEWYIANTDYYHYQIYKSTENGSIINIKKLTSTSPFISSNYHVNMHEYKGRYDAVLCTNDTEHNIVKEYSETEEYNNSSKVRIKRGWTKIPDTQNIEISLS